MASPIISAVWPEFRAGLSNMNRSNTITAEVTIHKGGAKGVVLAQAGRFGGWSLYLKNGRPTYTYNYLGLQRTTIAAPSPLPAGKATLRFLFDYDGGGYARVQSAVVSAIHLLRPRL